MSNIFITGISSGIGKALAESALQRGDTVWGLSRRGLGSHHPNLVEILLDLGDLDALPAQLSTWLEGAPAFDWAILNAAQLGDILDLKESSLAKLKALTDVNLWSNKVLIEALLSQAEPRQLIAISSGASRNGHRGWSGYSISKAALNMMIKLYAAEAPGTHFVSLAPGIVDTSMQADISVHPDPEKYTSLKRLRAARGTDAMPSPEAFAPHFWAALPRFIEHPSGSYLDVRELN